MGKKRTMTVLAMLLIIAGLIITLENYDIVKGLSVHWPALLVILGIGFGVLFFDRKKNDAAMIWISSYMILQGTSFYYLNFTSWAKLAYLWPIFLGMLGLSFLSAGLFAKKKILIYISIVFLALFLAFFIVFSISLRLWPMSLVVLGLSLLVIDYFNRKK